MAAEPIPPAPAPTLSTGTLFYLFGDQVVPVAEKGGAEVPYTGAKVLLADMAAVAFAASFWNLRRSGALQLQETTVKALGMIPIQHVQLTMLSGVAQKSGYEDVVMRAVAGGVHLAHDVVYRWFERDAYNPAGDSLLIAKREAQAFGLAKEVDAGRGVIGGFLKGDTLLEFDRDRIAPWHPTFEQAHGAWLEFCRAEQTLVGTLVESARLAFRNRQRTRDSRRRTRDSRR